jgi:hypothetical protein
MEGVKSKHLENRIKDLDNLNQVIEFKKDFFEKCYAAEYFFKKKNIHSYLKGYLKTLDKLESKDFDGLHLAILGTIREWLYDSLDTDSSNADEINNEIQNL